MLFTLWIWTSDLKPTRVGARSGVGGEKLKGGEGEW